MSYAHDPVEQLLIKNLNTVSSEDCPPLFARALDWAVFPSGGRIRPTLCLAVAQACSGRVAGATVAVATSLELLHCASLVHDDLPCFDDAATRRGKASVQRAFGERLAVLTGDALIVLAYENLANELQSDGELLSKLTLALSRGVGAQGGISAGQAWECELEIDLSVYQRAKTGSLFATATLAGALSVHAENSCEWAELGFRLGEAYQVADDILDAAGDPDEIGKPVMQDSLLKRPNAVQSHGLPGAAQWLRELVGEAIDVIPPCIGRESLQERIRIESDKLLPPHLAELAA